MSSVPPDDSASLKRTWLVFALGPYVMGASALDVEGIIKCPEPIAKLPLTPDYALGAFLFRGRSVAGISLRKKLRLTHGEDLPTGPFIVTRIGEALVAFWVDEVKDVIEEKDAAWRPMPGMLDGGLFERFAIRERQLILQTSFAALREAQVEFESLAARVAVEAVASPRAAGAAAPVAQTAARETKDEPARSQDSPAAAHDQPMLPAGPPVTPKPDLPARPVLTPRAAAGTTRVASARRCDPPVPSREMPGRIARAPGPVQTRVDTVAALESRSVSAAPMSFQAQPEPVAVEAGRRSTRLVITLGLGTAVIGGLVYLLLPTPADDSRARWVASTAAPSTRGAIAPAMVPSPQAAEQVTLTIERRQDVASDAKFVEAPAAAQPSTTRVHTVVKGDTLWQIAKRQVGDPFRYPELAKLSAIRDPDLIRPGDVIRIEIPKRR